MGSPHPQKRPSEGWLWPSALKRIFKWYTEWFGKDLNSCKKTGKKVFEKSNSRKYVSG